MSLYDQVFQRANIYDMIFFNQKTVLEYPTLDILKENNKLLYDRWEFLSKNKYDVEIGSAEGLKTYQDNACYYPEYSKIVAITFATLFIKDGEIKRDIKKNSSLDEKIVIMNFFDILYHFSNEGIRSTPYHFPTLCGYNLFNHEIPLLVKRFLLHNTDGENKMPYMLKRILDMKPWDDGVLDVSTIWKFNSNYSTSLMTISDFLGLKRTTDVLSNPELSKKYWEMYAINSDEALKFISLQSATHTNLVMQFMNKLSKL